LFDFAGHLGNYSKNNTGRKRESYEIFSDFNNSMTHLDTNQIVKTRDCPHEHIVVQRMRISDITDAVLSRGIRPDVQTMSGRMFDPRMFTIIFLSDDEMRQVNRFKALKKQIEWLCGRFAVKTLARDLLGLDMPLEEIRIAYREKGAPYLAQFPQVPISLSHSGNYTAAAISLDPGIGVGIDIEKIGDMPAPSFMNTAFTKQEIAHMPAAASAVFANWTLKEAFLKYLGLGFNESLHHVAVIDAQIFHHGKSQPVSTWQAVIDGRYALSLVYGKE
jgi:4'-phosphopantetheinyl transferase